jgi:hypothetical protein
MLLVMVNMFRHFRSAYGKGYIYTNTSSFPLVSTQHLSLCKWLVCDPLCLANLGGIARGLQWVT